MAPSHRTHPMDLFPSQSSAQGIQGGTVPALFPVSGPVRALVFGEAPGPRGADKSSIPFWGDAAGLPLYRALVRARCASVPEAAWLKWDGSYLLRSGFRPELKNVGLSNAYGSCPTADGKKFRAPTRTELQSPDNLERLEKELLFAQSRGALMIIALGYCARDSLSPLAAQLGFSLVALPHPSAQGLLSDAPNRGKGARLKDLAANWETRLVLILESAEH